jgi:hypothetical protein
MAGVNWTDSTIDAAGTRLHVSRAGRGRPVLVLHHEDAPIPIPASPVAQGKM